MLLSYYIRNSLSFCIMHPSVPFVKVLKKACLTRKIWEDAGVKVLRDLTEKSAKFSTLASSNTRFLLFFDEVDQ